MNTKTNVKDTKKKKTKKTKAIILLDRSGSMGSCAAMAVETFNEHVEEFQEQNKDKDMDIEVCLVTFNGQVYEHLWNVKPEKLEKSSLESFQPSGSTSLFDGIGYVVDKCNEEDDGETAYWMIVITDGYENTSKHYGNRNDPSIIAELLTGCDTNDRWTVTFLGSDVEKIVETASTQFAGAIDLGNAAAWSNTAAGTKRMSAQNKRATKDYFKGRKRGVTKARNLYSADAAVSNFTDTAGDADAQDKSLGIEVEVAALNAGVAAAGGAGAQCAVRGLGFATASINPQFNNSYVPDPKNIGTADVFNIGAENCVVSSDYSRPVSTTNKS